MSDKAKEAGLAALISGILGVTRADAQAPEQHPVTEAAPPTPEVPPKLQQEPTAAPPSKPSVPTSAAGADEKRPRLPAVAIADLVLHELRKMEGFPRSGVSITVYGYRNWNAMIRFAPFSITSQNAARLRKALPDIVFKLRHYVDIET
jgi:hypothetical protein